MTTKVKVVSRGESSVVARLENGGIRVIPTPLRPTTKYELAELRTLLQITSGSMSSSDKTVR